MRNNKALTVFPTYEILFFINANPWSLTRQFRTGINLQNILMYCINIAFAILNIFNC